MVKTLILVGIFGLATVGRVTIARPFSRALAAFRLAPGLQPPGPRLRGSRPSAAMVAIVLGCCPVLWASDQPGKRAGDLENYVLAVLGDPAPADVEVLINDEFAMSIVDAPPMYTEIGDLLTRGENSLKVVLSTPKQARTSSEPLRLEIRDTEITTTGRKTVGPAVAKVLIPEDVDPATACEETITFWIGGPDQARMEELKNDYWLFVTGPPVGVRVTVRINGAAVTDAVAGTSFIDVSPFVVKGKNMATFETRPTCLDRPSARDDALTFMLGAAEVELDTVQQTEPPQVVVEYRRKKRADPGTITRKFRAR